MEEIKMTFTRKKIAVIGAGYTGTSTALMLAQKELGDIILVDQPMNENHTKGIVLDMLQLTPVQQIHVNITGTSNYEDIQNADIVIITAGSPRKPGMSRDDLITINEKIIKDISEKIVRYAPNSYIIILSNPVDAMSYVCYKATGFPKNRVIGQSGVLDSARFNTFLSQELNVSVKDITSFVLGGHGDDMVPLVRYANIGGIPINELLPEATIESIVERTRKGGGEIINLLGQGSAYFAPAASLVKMTETILKDEKRVIPSVAYLDGEYGYHDLYLGVPTILGGNGVEKIIELPLTEKEKIELEKSVNSVKQVMSMLH